MFKIIKRGFQLHIWNVNRPVDIGFISKFIYEHSQRPAHYLTHKLE